MLGKAGTLIKPEMAFSPAAISGLVLWLAGNRSPITLNGSGIAQLDDYSGLGNHAVQETATNQPAYTATAIGGLPGATFDDVNDCMTISAATSINDLWSGGGYLVAVASAGSGGFARIADKAQWGIWVNGTTPSFYALFGATTGQWVVSNALTLDQPFLLEVEYDSDNAANDAVLRIDGGGTTSQPQTPTGTYNTDAANNLILGNTASAVNPWDGPISEVALYESIPSASEQMTLRNHFAAKYGIVLS